MKKNDFILCIFIQVRVQLPSSGSILGILIQNNDPILGILIQVGVQLLPAMVLNAEVGFT
ncbi:MAG: hypothetical protein ABIR66_11035 [Saprospiraceae bacterium]